MGVGPWAAIVRSRYRSTTLDSKGGFYPYFGTTQAHSWKSRAGSAAGCRWESLFRRELPGKETLRAACGNRLAVLWTGAL